ncbi:MAG TPA: protein kinase [Thermoanaerobaculia bacterium]|nr:protein kinase [Thermoanaerobaculia bacterium]
MGIPEKIGKYEISEQIGVGGFGAVYRGRDPFIKRTVAVKTCQLNDPEIKSRFFREAELAGNLHHRNITTIYDFGVENDVPYIVQEFLTGEDLDKIIKRGEKLPLARKIEILIAIAEGLHFAHEAHVIHRDIKPANIRILENGAVKIMDFGIAKSLQSESSLTQTGITLGTSAYLAPEQIRGETLDRRTDVFALGVLAYEVLAYQKPFRGEHLSTILYRILNEAPEPIESVAPDVPPALAAIVSKAIEKNIQNRYPSMEAMRQDLIAVYRQVAGGSGAIATRPTTQFGPTPFDPDETIKTPSKGMETSNITPPSGALARQPAPEDPTVISAATPAPVPVAPTPKSGGLELVNFRDPTQRTGDAKPAEAAEAAAAAPPAGTGRGVMIGAGLAAAAVIAIGVFLLTRTHKPEAPAAAPPEAPAKAVTAPIVFPAPQVGKDSANVPKPPAPAAAPAAKAKPAEKPPEEAVAEKPAPRKEKEAPAKVKSFKVQFSSIPVATLFVDGKKIGPSIPAQVVDLPEGKHTLRFETPDFPPYEKPFTVSSSGTPPIAYRFPVGVLVINSPAWAGANVLIDSKFKGILIGEKTFQLTSGSHKVTLSREGVNPYTAEVTVSEGEKKVLTPPAPTSAQEGSS